MDKYKVLKTLGDGTYGSVAMAINNQTNEQVAIKKMKKKFYSWDECMSLREIKALRKLNHPNLVKMKEVIRVNNDLYLVFEYMQGNVYELLKDAKQRGLTEDQIKSTLYQTLQGLDYMHQHGVFHRDLKPENLLQYNGQVKVADFGLSKDIRSLPPHTDYVSTRWYRAPEILLHSTTYSEKVDMFAMGCIAAELYSGQPLFPGRSEQDQLYRICALLGKPPAAWTEGYNLAINIGTVFPHFQACDISKILSRAPPVAIDLITKLLMWDPSMRPSARDSLNHPYFEGLRKTVAVIEQQVELQAVPQYNGPNHNSSSLAKRNSGLIQNAVQQQLFGERRDEQYGFKTDLYFSKFGNKYTEFPGHQQPFQQQSQTHYPKYNNLNSLPSTTTTAFSRQQGLPPQAPPPLQQQDSRGPQYYDEASKLNQGGRKLSVFNQNFDQMLRKNNDSFQPVPVIDQRYQPAAQAMNGQVNYKNFNSAGGVMMGMGMSLTHQGQGGFGHNMGRFMV